MKNLIKALFTIAITSLISCGGGGGDTPPPPPENKAPGTPSLAAPTDNLLCIDNSVTFSWSVATDPDGDAVSYTLQIATDNQFTNIAHSIPSISGTSRSVVLNKGVAYYWRVQAKDAKNAASDYSAVRQFYTEGEAVSNHLPFAPQLVSPALNSVVQTATATLEWDASDVDNDPLSYTVFFDTVNPPVASVATDQSGKTYTASINASTTYYWKVEVKDDKGGTTIGQVWSFSRD